MKDEIDIPATMDDMGRRAVPPPQSHHRRSGSRLPALRSVADYLARADDVVAERRRPRPRKGLSKAMLDRLKLDTARISGIAELARQRRRGSDR